MPVGYSLLLLLSLLANLVHGVSCAGYTGSQQGHTSNWAVIVNVSRYWFNYRHASNIFSLYHSVKRLGIPDERIIAMNADDFACNPRNPFPSKIFNDKSRVTNLYTDSIEVDYRNYDVTLATIMRVLTDRHPPGTAQSKRLLSDENSNVILYITGHGGDEFMKIQDHEEISAQDVAEAIAEMHARKRYKNLFLVLETCQAATMFARVRSPNVFLLAASKRGENSYSHHIDRTVGVSVVDRFTYTTQHFFQGLELSSNRTLQDWYDALSYHEIHSTIETNEKLITRRPKDIRIAEFFGSEAMVKPTRTPSVPMHLTAAWQHKPGAPAPQPSWMQHIAVATA